MVLVHREEYPTLSSVNELSTHCGQVKEEE